MTWQVASVRDGVRQELKLCTWWRRWPRTGLDRDDMLTNKALADDHSISDSTWVAVQRARCELMDTWNRRSIVRAKKENWSLQHLESGRRCRCGLAWDTVQHRVAGCRRQLQMKDLKQRHDSVRDVYKEALQAAGWTMIGQRPGDWDPQRRMAAGLRRQVPDLVMRRGGRLLVLEFGVQADDNMHYILENKRGKYHLWADEMRKAYGFTAGYIYRAVIFGAVGTIVRSLTVEPLVAAGRDGGGEGGVEGAEDPTDPPGADGEGARVVEAGNSGRDRRGGRERRGRHGRRGRGGWRPRRRRGGAER